jgi:hypothetical protein
LFHLALHRAMAAHARLIRVMERELAKESRGASLRAIKLRQLRTVLKAAKLHFALLGTFFLDAGANKW